MLASVMVDSDFMHNYRTKLLLKQVGFRGVMALLTLWCEASENIPNGVFKDMSVEDVGCIAGWGGKAEVLIDALIHSHYLQICCVGYELINWWPVPVDME